MNLKKFKKVAEDKHTSTLKHADGHSITVVHAALGPDMQKQLKSLKLENGGQVRHSAQGTGEIKGTIQDHDRGAQSGEDLNDSWHTLKNAVSNAFSSSDPTPLPPKPDMPPIKVKGYADGGQINPKLQESRKDPHFQHYADGTPDGGVSDSGSSDDSSDATPPKQGHITNYHGPVTINNGIPPTQAAAPQSQPMSKPEVEAVSPQEAQAKGYTAPQQDQASPQATESQDATNQQAAQQGSQPVQDATQASSGQVPAPTSGPMNGPPNQAQAAPQQQAAPAPMDDKQATAQELRDHDMAWQQDLANGHVTPETYGSLFDKKDTLGKIGQIFGLLVGGIGSGMTGQPNAALQMMDNVIKNDLAAQTQNKTNAQNFIKLNQQQELNTADIKNKVQTGKLTMAQAANVQAEANTKAFALANIQANRSMVHKLAGQVASLPEGSPERAQAEQALAMVSKGVENENYNITDQAAAKTAYLKQMGINMAGEPTTAPNGQSGSKSTGGQSADPAAQTALQLRKMQAIGTIDKDQYTKANEELKLIQNKQQANRGALDSFDKVAKMQTVGNRVGSPVQSLSQINAEWDPMLDKLTKSNEGRVTPITVDMMNALKPTIRDNAETTAIKRQKLNEILNSGFSTPTLDGLHLTPTKASNPPQETTQSSVPVRGGIQEGATATNPKTGQKVTFRNGKWQ